MNHESSSEWPSLVAGAGDDFSFLEFPDLGVDFPALDAPTDAADVQSHPPQLPGPRHGSAAEGEGPASGSAAAMSALRHKASNSQLLAHGGQQQPQQALPFATQGMAQFYGHGGVPPTPNSMEMHGMHRHFSTVDPQHTQAMFEAYQRKQQEQVRHLLL